MRTFMAQTPDIGIESTERWRVVVFQTRCLLMPFGIGLTLRLDSHISSYCRCWSNCGNGNWPHWLCVTDELNSRFTLVKAGTSGICVFIWKWVCHWHENVDWDSYSTGQRMSMFFGTSRHPNMSWSSRHTLHCSVVYESVRYTKIGCAISACRSQSPELNRYQIFCIETPLKYTCPMHFLYVQTDFLSVIL